MYACMQQKNESTCRRIGMKVNGEWHDKKSGERGTARSNTGFFSSSSDGDVHDVILRNSARVNAWKARLSCTWLKAALKAHSGDLHMLFGWFPRISRGLWFCSDGNILIPKPHIVKGSVLAPLVSRLVFSRSLGVPRLPFPTSTMFASPLHGR